MVSLLDITPALAKDIKVMVRGVDVDVKGLGLEDIAFLIQKFPEVKDLFAGKDVVLTFDTLMDKAPKLVYAIIGRGTGTPLTADGLTRIISLSLDEQSELLEAIFNETFKGGAGPFVARVKRLFGGASDLGSKA